MQEYGFSRIRISFLTRNKLQEIMNDCIQNSIYKLAEDNTLKV